MCSSHYENWSYSCDLCNFSIDIYCALKSPTVAFESKEKGQHLCHKQPMKHVEIKHGKEVKCYICELPLLRQAYTCNICRYFFHKSCIELLPEPIHLKPTLMYPTHDHLLCLKRKRNEDEKTRCNACYTYCKQLVACNELAHTERYIFCCQNCNFEVHLLCGLLPCVIKHNCHIHPLTLVDSLVEDDTGEYYCDVCETERDPRICVYYCEECKFISHVYCVISEVVRILQGDCKDVELRIVGQRISVVKPEHILKQVEKRINNEGLEQEEVIFLTLEMLILLTGQEQGIDLNNHLNFNALEELEEADKEGNDDLMDHLGILLIIRCLTDQRKKYINFDPKNNLTKSGNQEEQTRESIQDQFSSYTFEELVRRLKNFNHPTRWSKITSNELRLKTVKVGGYVITWNLAYVLKDLLDNHGDISGGDNNKLSLSFKCFIFFLVCRLLYNMSRTMVIDLTEDLLGDWYACMQFVKSKGFKVDFINYGLEQVTRAYFGLQAELEEYERHVTGKIDSSLEIKDDLVKDCMMKATKLKWKYVTDCLS
ncbi:uncharacterized protein LOC132799527 [Ziziphus jujuba]|uniref:Uncharacterized protein LOC132799527 n=1 Tax=Ziziphus jujuba TaxID=326968 RepID=A0ABM3ZSV7_ZIZJJ|nr:uncharacterized protein LOC132799527 [Ziziphus jujuba]